MHPSLRIERMSGDFEDSAFVWSQDRGVVYSCHPQYSLVAAVTMHKRFLVTTFLGIALLFSQGGIFLVGALCPHLRSGSASCDMQVSATEMSHEEMGHMDMGSTDNEPVAKQDDSAAQPNTEADAMGQPTTPCSHCAVHSRSNSNAISLRETEAPKRSAHSAISLTVSTLLPVVTSSAAVLTFRAHGPPGDLRPRHILINIFRI